MLKSEYADNMSQQECLALAVKTLSKTMDTTAPSADRMEFSVLTLGEGDEPSFRVLNKAETTSLLNEVASETADAGDV